MNQLSGKVIPLYVEHIIQSFITYNCCALLIATTGRAPTATAPLAAQEVGDQTRPSIGRGASRGREQREAVIITRPSIEFIKMGKKD